MASIPQSALFVVLTSLGAVEPTPLAAPITSASLFKNGLAVIRRTVQVPGEGTFTLASCGQPIHGAWAVDGPAGLVVRTGISTVEEPGEINASTDPVLLFAGKEVQITLRDAPGKTLSGVLLSETSKPGNSGGNSNPFQYDPWGRPLPITNTSPQIILRTGIGLTWIDRSNITSIQCADTRPPMQKVQRPTLSFTLPAKTPAGPIVLTTLERGLSWAPHYRLELEGTQGRLTQSTVIRNELEGFDAAEVNLITGFPNLPMANVVSPLFPNTTWQNFFQQLEPQHNRGNMYLSQMAINRAMPRDSDSSLPINPQGEGSDLYSHSIGVQRLAKGENLGLTIAQASVSVQREVEWTLRNNRNEHGRIINENDYERQQNPDKFEDQVWDVLKFPNPLKIPLTTAPAMVMESGLVTGQGTIYFTAIGEETRVQVTKSLRVRTRHSESETKREEIPNTTCSSRVQKQTMKGELSIINYRNQTLNIVIRRPIFGQFLSGDGEPKVISKPASGCNTAQEIVWNFTLEGGKDKTLTYTYTVNSH